jgi:hypothetical protein
MYTRILIYIHINLRVCSSRTQRSNTNDMQACLQNRPSHPSSSQFNLPKTHPNVLLLFGLPSGRFQQYFPALSSHQCPVNRNSLFSLTTNKKPARSPVQITEFVIPCYHTMPTDFIRSYTGSIYTSLRTLFSSACNLCSSVEVKGHVSCPRKQPPKLFRGVNRHTHIQFVQSCQMLCRVTYFDERTQIPSVCKVFKTMSRHSQ